MRARITTGSPTRGSGNVRQGLLPASVTFEQHIRFNDSRLGQRPARACTPASVTFEQHIRFTESGLGQRSARGYTPASVTFEQHIKFTYSGLGQRFARACVRHLRAAHQVHLLEAREALRQGLHPRVRHGAPPQREFAAKTRDSVCARTIS